MNSRRTLALLLSLILLAGVRPAEEKTVSRAAYRVLTAAEKSRSAGRLEQAEAALRAFLEGGRRDPAEEALARVSRGQVLQDAGRRGEACEELSAALALDALPPGLARDTRYSLAAILLARGREAEAAEHLERWLAATGEAAPEVRATLAGIRARGGDRAGALRAIRAAIEESPAPREEWMTFEAGLHAEQGDLDAARRVLEARLLHFPDSPDAWGELASVAEARGEPDRALGLLRLGRLAGALDRAEDLRREAHRLLARGLVLEAAHLLERGIEQGTLPPEPADRELLEACQRRLQAAPAPGSTRRGVP